MTPTEINNLHMSGIQFPLDSDEIESALADANLDPQTCAYVEAVTACQEYANAIRAFGQSPTRGGRRTGAGAPKGNQNNKRNVVRPHRIQIHVSDNELAAITAAAGDVPLARWVREVALEKATTFLASVDWEMAWKADWISQCIGGSFEDWYEKLLAESKATQKDDK